MNALPIRVTQSPGMTEHADKAPRRQAMTLRRRFIVIGVTFSLAIAVLVGVTALGFQALSGARAYVQGESHWTKAQKQAVVSLLDYARTQEPGRLERFRQALEVYKGDREARRALEATPTDRDAAREGFIRGRNDPADVELLIWLYLLARPMQSFDQAVEIWQDAEAAMEALEAEGESLVRAMREAGPASDRARRIVDRLLELDRKLTDLQARFSAAIGEVNRQLTTTLTLAMIVIGLIVILGGNLLAHRLVRSAERHQSALRTSEQRFRALVDQPEVGMWQLTPDGRIEYLNPAMRRLLGVDENEDVGGLAIEQFVDKADHTDIASDRDARVRGERTAREVTMISRDGAIKNALVHGAAIVLDDGTVHGHVGSCVDITARKAAEEELRYQAYHDQLSGLPNRQLFLDRLDVAARRLKRGSGQMAVTFIDLDRFKIVNDSMGHAVGDQLLRKATTRLRGAVREQDTIARFGGDEFGLILEGIESHDDARRPAQRILEAFSREFRVAGTRARISASIGIALSSDESRPGDLLRHADIAMYVAKRRGGNTLHFYDPETDVMESQRLHLENELRQAVQRGELELHYQPIIELGSGRAVNLEALIRWRHPERGLLPPDAFIPLAEEIGAIADIGHWVTRQACRDLRELQAQLGDQAPDAVSVNLSIAEFRHGNPLASIARSAAEAGIRPQQLQLEVTESTLVEQPGVVNALEEQGFPVAIDDFGTGYASLDLRREVRISTIKIDSSFVQRLQGSQADHAVVESILLLARKLDLTIVAEGIETEAQAEQLQALGCRLGQGFLYSGALDLKSISDWLKFR